MHAPPNERSGNREYDQERFVRERPHREYERRPQRVQLEPGAMPARARSTERLAGEDGRPQGRRLPPVPGKDVSSSQGSLNTTPRPRPRSSNAPRSKEPSPVRQPPHSGRRKEPRPMEPSYKMDERPPQYEQVVGSDPAGDRVHNGYRGHNVEKGRGHGTQAHSPRRTPQVPRQHGPPGRMHVGEREAATLQGYSDTEEDEWA